MDEKSNLTIRVRSGQNTSSQDPGQLLSISHQPLDNFEEPKNRFLTFDTIVSKKIKFLRFTVRKNDLESKLKLRIRDTEGVSYDGDVSFNWAQKPLKHLLNNTACEITTDGSQGKFRSLLNAYFPTTDFPKIEPEDLIFPEVKYDPLLCDVKMEPADMLFQDWIEPSN